ncbi:hypothetical protein [Streptomyces sp. NRRL WC-3742]|uniref:hypothetical protein n=1 Tax=Streptomyces sp. NRRL WC-3742 TaxID=1463934 RepID=UPI00068D4D2D|nr:hypothetical protein [Streptomyces sp. NRRL WC-3742]
MDPAGAGHSKVAELLAARLHPSVHLRTDDFLRVIRDTPTPLDAQRRTTTALAAAAQAAFAYATGGYQVVLESPAAPPTLDTFRRESRTTGAALHYVVLSPSSDDPGATAEPTPEATADSILTSLPHRTHLLGW